MIVREMCAQDEPHGFWARRLRVRLVSNEGVKPLEEIWRKPKSDLSGIDPGAPAAALFSRIRY